MRILNECTSLQSTTDYFENESNNINCQNINKSLLTISEAASEGLGLAIQLSQLPLNTELYNALVIYFLFF